MQKKWLLLLCLLTRISDVIKIAPPFLRGGSRLLSFFFISLLFWIVHDRILRNADYLPPSSHLIPKLFSKVFGLNQVRSWRRRGTDSRGVTEEYLTPWGARVFTAFRYWSLTWASSIQSHLCARFLDTVPTSVSTQPFARFCQKILCAFLALSSSLDLTTSVVSQSKSQTKRPWTLLHFSQAELYSFLPSLFILTRVHLSEFC